MKPIDSQTPIERAADTVPEFAASIPCAVSTAWKLIKEGKIRPIRIGRRTLITRAERDRFLAALQQDSAA